MPSEIIHSRHRPASGTMRRESTEYTCGGVGVLPQFFEPLPEFAVSWDIPALAVLALRQQGAPLRKVA